MACAMPGLLAIIATTLVFTSFGASVSSVLGALSPLFGIPVSVAVLGEKISKIAVLGVIISIFGIVLVVIGL